MHLIGSWLNWTNGTSSSPGKGSCKGYTTTPKGISV